MLALLGLIVVLVLNIFPSALFATSKATEQIEAESLAQSYLEEARALPFSSLSSGPARTLSPADSKYTVTREFYDPPATHADKTRGIRVTVRWTSQGTPREIKREVWVSSVRS